MTDYLYATSESVGAMLSAKCITLEDALPYVQWVISKQHADGGWGESPESYIQKTYVDANSTLTQSEWALTFLMNYESARKKTNAETASAFPQIEPQIEKGITFLLNTMGEQATPFESEFTGTFVRGVWYARYVSLAHYEGIRALGSYLSLKTP